MRITAKLAAGSLAGLILISGCATEPSTSANNPRRDQITINDLRTAGDEVAQALAADLENLVRSDFGGERVALFFGDISNKTGSVPTTDFDVVRRQIRNEMFRNPYFRDNVQLREASSRARANSNREREGGSGDPFGGSEGFQGLDVDPNYVFFLNGDARKLDRQSETGFFIEFTVTRESNAEIVFTNDYFVQYGG
jgi:hypothetical protein